MKSTKRALRRHHRRRMLQHALRSHAVTFLSENDPEGLQCRAVRWFNNLQKCSCYMCGNPRKYEGTVPVQEQRLRQTARYEEAELLSSGFDLPPLSE